MNPWLLALALAAPDTLDTPASDTLARIVELPPIEVSTARAGDRAPLARSTLDRERIARLNWGQDTPMALASLPGAYAYSDAGNGIGYSYLSIRGFPQRRISVLVDGVPLNDPESHEVYWIDHPDLLASTAEVQLQRGVGSALYGSASVGGSVDLEVAPFGDEPRTTAAVGFGSWNTKRVMVESSSGPLRGGWSTYARYSRIETDGYRDQSWSRLWSYALSARRVAGRQSIRVSLFGGPEETHLAYKGVPLPYLRGEVTGDRDRDRRFNPLTYPGEADHFFEPHYELIHSWSPRDGLAMTQTLFWFDGRGYYDEQRFDLLTNYRLAPWAADTTLFPAADFDDGYGNQIRDSQGRLLLQRTNLVRRRFVQNHHYGWIPRVRIEHRGGALTAGGELRAHDGHHMGTVIGADGLPPGTEADHLYYDYHPRTLSGALFVREEWRPLATLGVTADLAWRHQSYAMRGDRFGGVRFDQTYDFAVPRIGVTATPRPGLDLFGSWASSSREPAFLNLFNPEAAGSLPNYRERDPVANRYGDPLSRPEKVNDLELGVSWTRAGLSASAGAFRMDFRDELVDYQFDSDLAQYVTANAARSVHQGVELAARGSWPRGGGAGRGPTLTLEANSTLSDNHFVRFREQLDPVTVIDHDGKAIGFFPAVLANLSARAGWRGAHLGAAARHAGRVYLDQNEDAAASTDPRTVLDLDAGWRVRFGEGATAGLAVRLFNALDTRYTTGGYFDYDAAGSYVPHFVPAATRNVLVEARAEF